MPFAEGFGIGRECYSGYVGRNEHALAHVERDAVATRRVNRQPTCHADQDYERVEMRIVVFHFLREIQDVGHEIVAGYGVSGCVLSAGVGRFVVVVVVVVDGVNGEVGVEVAFFAGGLVNPVEVVNPVRGVGRLLDFGQQ